MKCLELSIPPLPQFVMAGFTVWPAGTRHFARSIDVYDVLVVASGKVYMTEDGIPYEIGAGELFVLTPGSLHYGHRGCDVQTEIYWLHFIHSRPVRALAYDEIPWLSVLPGGSSKDETPPPHCMYIPKQAALDMTLFRPHLDRMVRLHGRIRIENALELHMLLTEFLFRVQQIAGRQFVAPSQRVSYRFMEYAESHYASPFKRRHVEEALHYRYDYIARCFKKHAGMTPVEYVQHVRMEEARRLLVSTEMTVREVGEAVGLPDGNYFIKTFRKTTGLTPGKYRAFNAIREPSP
jgi:AraC-type DNA-binding domain-containing proteins